MIVSLVSPQLRINLSPFTKDFRGEAQHNESLLVFWSPPSSGSHPKHITLFVNRLHTHCVFAHHHLFVNKFHCSSIIRHSWCLTASNIWSSHCQSACTNWISQLGIYEWLQTSMVCSTKYSRRPIGWETSKPSGRMGVSQPYETKFALRPRFPSSWSGFTWTSFLTCT
jgi:hypothetical protein